MCTYVFNAEERLQDLGLSVGKFFGDQFSIAAEED
jgi:hypothetical protein